MVDIAIVGYNDIAEKVLNIIKEKNKTKKSINVKYIFGAKKLNRSSNFPLFINNIETILKDSNVKIVVEVIDDFSKAYFFTKKLLEKGKHVITSNKKLVSEKGEILTQLASKNHVNYFFEASVDGSIPIVKPLLDCSKNNDILEIDSILNITSNFILTKLFEENINFEEALSLAKDNNFTENNFKEDINGQDSSRKLSILTSLAFGKHILPSEIHTKGIENLNQSDIIYAKNFGAVIKLISRVVMMENERLQISTEPMFVPKSNQLASIDGSYSAVLLKGDKIDEVMFYGNGAGPLTMATAIVTDIINCSKYLNEAKFSPWQKAEHGYIMPYSSTITAIYTRVLIEDISKRELITDLIAYKFDEVEFLHRQNQNKNELAFVTNVSTIKNLKGKLNELYDYGIQISSIMRII